MKNAIPDIAGRKFDGLGAPVIRRISNEYERYKADRWLGEIFDRTERADEFLSSLERINSVFKDDKIMLQILDGINRSHPRTIYSTVSGIKRLIDGLDGNSIFDKELLTRTQAVLDRYHGGSALMILEHIEASLKTGKHIEVLLKTFGSEEVIRMVNEFQAVDDEYFKVNKKSTMDGWFLANDIGYIAVNTNDAELAIESAGIITERAVFWINIGDSKAFDEWMARGKALLNASWDFGADGVRRMISFIGSISEGDFYAFNSLFDWMNEKERMAKFLANDLDLLLMDDFSSLWTVELFLSSKIEIPAPTIETANRGFYPEFVRKSLEDRYEIELTMEQLRLFISAGAIADEAGFFGMLKSGERNVKYYGLDIGNGIASADYTKQDLEEYALAVLYGSRDKGKEAKAFDALKSIIGETKVNRARNAIRTRHREVLREISGILSNQAYQHAEKIGRSLEVLRLTVDESVIDVLRAVNYKEERLRDAHYLRAAESKNPLDYNSDVQYACTFLPESDNADTIRTGILTYCSDERFVLVKYGIGEKTYGSAICYLEDNVFLVDSVEGHTVMRRESTFEIIYNDLIGRAADLGAERIVFGAYNGGNTTAIQFLKHVEAKGLDRLPMSMRLDTEGYLESGESDHVYALDLKATSRS